MYCHEATTPKRRLEVRAFLTVDCLFGGVCQRAHSQSSIDSTRRLWHRSCPPRGTDRSERQGGQCMKAFNLRLGVGAFLLLMVPLVRPDLAGAEVPTLGSFLDSGQLGQPRRHGHGHRHHKPFLHHEGLERLREAKRNAAVLAPSITASPRGLLRSTVVGGFDGIDESASLAIPPDGAIAVSAAYIVEAVNDNLSIWTKTYGPNGELSAGTPVVAAADLNFFFGNNPNCFTPANHFFRLISDPSLDYYAVKDRFILSITSFQPLLFTS